MENLIGTCRLWLKAGVLPARGLKNTDMKSKGKTFIRASESGPLTEAEITELDDFLTYEVDSDEVMMIDMLDGYLHAIACARRNF
jgi:hypothetical protein